MTKLDLTHTELWDIAMALNVAILHEHECQGIALEDPTLMRRERLFQTFMMHFDKAQQERAGT